MANIIIRQIPNSITCCNLISGCMATGAAFYGNYSWAFLLIVIGAVFDFFDGMSARVLKVSSPIGKEFVGRCSDLWSSPFGHDIPSVPSGGLPRLHGTATRRDALYGFPYGGFFGFAISQIQYRHAANIVFHRRTYPGQHLVLGFADCGQLRFFGFRKVQCFLPFHVHVAILFPFGSGDSHVRPQIQEPFLARQ